MEHGSILVFVLANARADWLAARPAHGSCNPNQWPQRHRKVSTRPMIILFGGSKVLPLIILPMTASDLAPCSFLREDYWPGTQMHADPRNLLALVRAAPFHPSSSLEERRRATQDRPMWVLMYKGHCGMPNDPVSSILHIYASYPLSLGSLAL